MPTARIDKATYDLLLNAFRERPGVYTFAAGKAGVSHKTARRAWTKGWERPTWAKPIEQIVENERMGARAILVAEEKVKTEEQFREARQAREQDLARIDAIEERAREAQAIRSAFSSSMTLFANLGLLSKASIEMSKKASEMILEDVKEGKIAWEKAIQNLYRLGRIGIQASEQLQNAMEMLRLHLGNPQKIVGVQESKVQSFTEIDPEKAANALGPERLRQALLDLAQGKMTEDVDRLIAWQVDEVAPHVH